jgi:D-inositol-3-phosphate glycosyltransferase
MTVYVRELADAMATSGVRTDIFTRAGSESPTITDVGPHVRVISIQAGPLAPIPKEEMTGHIGRFAAGVRAFAAGQRIGYDVVHSHYWQSGLAADELRASWDVPWVHSQHTLARVKNLHLAPGDQAESARRIEGEDDVTSAADVLIASTDDEWQQLSCLYGVAHDRLKTIHPGVDHQLFRPDGAAGARRELGLRDEAVLLCVGRIQPLKGLELAIRSAAVLGARLDRRVVLMVVGGASGSAGQAELGRLQDLAASLGVTERVRFEGPQEHSRLPLYYRAADVLLVCSHSESFGLAALEAHACATPVVGTPVGGLSHIVCDGASGFLVPTRDPAVFAARIEPIVSDAGLRSFFSATAVRSARMFSWERTAAAHIELYDCLIREGWPQLCTC